MTGLPRGRSALKLELGCGRLWGDPAYRRADVGLDLARPCSVMANLLAPLPFADGSFEHVFAQDVLEHIPGPRQYHVWNEVHRVLSSGGVFEGGVPGADLDYSLATRDPTHICWFVEGTFSYLCAPPGTPLADEAFHAGRAPWALWEVEMFHALNPANLAKGKDPNLEPTYYFWRMKAEK